MKFNVEIDLNEYFEPSDFSERSLSNVIIDKVAYHISKMMFEKMKWEDLRPSILTLETQARLYMKQEIAKEIQNIKETVISKISNMRDLRELCTSDTKNKKFIEEVVNECLRKKLGA